MSIKPDKEYVVVMSEDDDAINQVDYYTSLGFYIKSKSTHIITMERDATDEPAKPYKDHVRESRLFAKTDDFLNKPSWIDAIMNLFRKKNK